MNQESPLSLLAGQILCVKSHARRARESGEDPAPIDKIVGSLRLTLAAALSGRTPKDVDATAFVLEAGVVREHTVTLGDRSVPVSGSYLEALLHRAGLQLAPQQVLLLEAGLVRDLVEEALGRIAHDQAEIAREKARLEAILRRTPDLHEGILEEASREASSKAEDVRHRKVELLSAGLALDELSEQKASPKRVA
jgi:hypothetical protein